MYRAGSSRNISFAALFTAPVTALFTALFAALGVSASVGCSGGSSGDAAGDGDAQPMGGSGSAKGSGGDAGGDGEGMGGEFPGAIPIEDDVVGVSGAAFLPDGITFNYSGDSEVPYEIVASTLLQAAGNWDEPTWFVAVENVGSVTMCNPALNYEMFDSNGFQLEKDYAFMQAPMYMSYGDPTPCLGPGDIGMMEITYGLDDLLVAQVARIDYFEGGALTLSATRIEDVVVTEVNLEPIYTDSVHLVGTVFNGHSHVIDAPQVFAYAVDAIGRPYALMKDIELVTIQSGANWNFDTLSVENDVDNFVIYLDYRYPL